ncbi:MAG: bifunctional adenosylcobinamide kinase/adenosylcobinamide-phosphate guanylyltransferase [Litoreibacter sp.]|nr:bifunctional adenosylcobinamide kinase/adenosylcobinamide-phosphate guanylyltransferase [Litoreibacter sp.]
MPSIPALTLVIGGASSGKSAFAERLVIAAGTERCYIATAQAFDDEMREKIILHQNDRAAHGWKTEEAPLDPGAVIGGLGTDQTALLDCATMWLNNLFMAEADLDAAFEGLVAVLAGARAPVVVVTNEVGLGIVPENALARQFRQAQGRLNAMLAARAGLVVQVTAGLPLVLKGHLPEALG